MSTDREDLFFAFLERATGMKLLTTLQGPTINSIVGAFEACHPARSSVGHERLPDFTDAIFSEPFTVYLIRNTVTGRAYIGRALEGFTTRYPRGEWWANDAGRDRHHSDRLAQDVLMFGLAAFHVHIHVCNDAEHASLVESQLIAAHRRCTYNLLPEPTAVVEQPFDEQVKTAQAAYDAARAKHGLGVANE